MSSRALRKLQKEQEQEKQLAILRAGEDDEQESEEDVEPEQASSKPATKLKLNAFDLLNGVNAGEEDSDDAEDDIAMSKTENLSSRVDPNSQTNHLEPAKGKKKKKKSKKKNKSRLADDGATPTTGIGAGDEAEMDEIDRALMALSTKDGKSRAAEELNSVKEQQDENSLWEVQATKLLAIAAKNLNPVNEMKSLFGNIVLEGSSDSRSSTRNQRRREQNQQGGVDLETALTGSYSPASKGKVLGALASRRNIFMQGREEWPLATSGGLSMEYLVSDSFQKNYSIAHNNTYLDVQHQFRLCVESMEAENMIHLLTLNPYHIATLLQVSEIAKHQGDHSVSGDLLERALFSFGRSVHSTFPNSLREGTVRVAFDKPANRELYLTIWRYIQNLSQRGTWRTAFEWAKMLFQFNTLSDPYGITLMIDQLALRGRQHSAFIELCTDDAYGISWSHLPNIQISLALAHQRSLSPKLARQTLAIAMSHYPYILSSLASSLDISPLPKFLWGKLPSTDAEKLYTELYVTRTKDLWNTPEATSLIVEVAETIEMYSSLLKSTPAAPKLEISLEEARHIMLLEVPSLIALLPRRFKNMPTSSSDVLPPPSSVAEGAGLVARAPTAQPGGGIQTFMNATGNVGAAAAAGGAGVLTRLLNWFQSPVGPGEGAGRGDGEEGEGAAAIRELNESVFGASPEMLQEILAMHLEAQTEADGRALPGQWIPEEGSLADSDIDDNQIAGLDVYQPRETRNAEELFTDSMVGAPSSANNQSNSSRPPAPVVEDDDEEEYDASIPEHSPDGAFRRGGGPILRHVDSDSDSDFDGDLGTFTPPSHQTAAPASSSGVNASDPQRVQRWLLSTGLLNLENDSSTLNDYVRKLKGLRPRDQDWTVNMVKQRAGNGVAEMIKRDLGR